MTKVRRQFGVGSVRRLLLAAAAIAAVTTASGCGSGAPDTAAPASAPPGAHTGGFHSGECNLVTDAEVTKAVGSPAFTKVVDNDLGCFWQENAVFGTVGAGMGISTWWYRGSDMDTERMLEQQAGRTITELELSGNKGFRASDSNACSIYVAKQDDVITWSIQTLNPATLPDLCGIAGQLAQLSQDRVN